MLAIATIRLPGETGLGIDLAAGLFAWTRGCGLLTLPIGLAIPVSSLGSEKDTMVRAGFAIRLIWLRAQSLIAS